MCWRSLVMRDARYLKEFRRYWYRPFNDRGCRLSVCIEMLVLETF